MPPVLPREAASADPVAPSAVPPEAELAATREWVVATAKAGALVGWAQPIFDRDGRLVAAEMLARCPFPDGSLRSPARFAEALGRTGTWAHLDTAMLGEAARLARRAAGREHGAGFTVAWNTAVSTLSGWYFDAVTTAIATEGLDPNQLCLELTEHITLESGEAVEVIRAIRGLGVRIALDDIGENPSLLRALRSIGLDVIKLDRPLLGELSSEHGERLIAGLIRLAHDLGAQVVAEGVETDAVHDRLHALGCDQFQGNLFGAAMPTAGFAERWLGLDPA